MYSRDITHRKEMCVNSKPELLIRWGPAVMFGVKFVQNLFKGLVWLGLCWSRSREGTLEVPKLHLKKNKCVFYPTMTLIFFFSTKQHLMKTLNALTTLFENRESTALGNGKLLMTCLLLLSSSIKYTLGGRSDLSQQGSHLQSQFLVDGEVTRHNGLVCLIGQQQPLPLWLPSPL